MAKKTNKTSHVMDLLTNGASPETEEPVADSAAPGQEKKNDVPTHGGSQAKVTVVDEGSQNDRISQEILGKLTEEFEEESKQEQAGQNPEEISGNMSDNEAQTGHGSSSESSQAASQASDEAVPDPVPEDALQASQTASDSTDSQSEENPLKTQSSAQQNSSGTPNTTANKKDPHPIIPESHFSSHTQHREYRFINVMEQLLMRQDLESVLKQHDVCTCPRCMSDVCALALTGLPAKYVVTSKDSISPLLSYYENKYKIPILTEMMKACNKVRENPRHKK